MAKFELSEEAKAAGLSFGQNPNIREEDRQEALAQFRAQMNAANSPEVYSGPQRQSVGLSDAQAAQLMGREVNYPPVSQRVMPRPNVASPHDFQPPQSFETNYPSGPRFHNQGLEENYPSGPRFHSQALEQGYPSGPRFHNQGFEEGYPMRRDTAIPPRLSPQGSPVRTNSYVNNAASDFLERQNRVAQNVPLSREMINNPARESLTRAIGDNSENVYENRRREVVNQKQMPNILAKQKQDELEDYRSQKGPYYDGKKAPTNKQLKERFEYFFKRLKNAEEDTPYKKGGVVKKTKPVVKKTKPQVVKSNTSKRGDGIAKRGKTKGRMV